MICLSDDDLFSFSAGVLAESRALDIERHLDTCSRCRSVVCDVAALMADDDADEVAPSGSRLHDPTDRPEVTGSYLELGQHALGGQGRVVVVYDRVMGREVALKELKDSGGAAGHTERAVLARERFQREARITGQLNHPTIVQIYELGIRSGGQLYYTMPLVAGETLAAAIRACNKLSERLALLPHFVDVCQGVAYAHSRGVVHRDLKPQNVMVGEFGETLLLDWGLAKTLQGASLEAAATSSQAAETSPDGGHTPQLGACGEMRREPPLSHSGSGARAPAAAIATEMERAQRVDQRLAAGGGATRASSPPSLLDLKHDLTETSVGTFTGTPSYASPEQVAGRAHAADQRTDVWGLGAILYELLTGRAPFHTTPRAAPDEPPAIAELCSQAPTELVAIATKALRVDPADRYPSADALCKDVTAYLAGQRVEAHEYRAWALLKRYVRRYRFALATSAVVIGMTVAALTFVSIAYHQADTALGREEQAVREEQGAREREQEQRLLASYQLAQALASKADRLAAERFYLSAGIYAAASLQNNPAYARSTLYRSEFASAHPGSADLVARSRARLYEGRLSPIERPLHAIAGDSVVFAATFSPDGARMAVGTRDGHVRVLDAATGRELKSWRVSDDYVRGVAYTPDGRVLVVASGRTVSLWTAGNFDIIRRLKGHLRGISAVAVAPDGHSVATAGADGTLRLWDITTGTVVRQLQPETHATVIAFSPDGQTLATGGLDRRVTLWNVRSGEAVRRLDDQGATVTSLAFSPTGRLLAAGSENNRVQLWDPLTGRRGPELSPRASLPLGLDFSPDGRMLAVAGSGQRIDLWALSNGRHLGAVHAHEASVNSVRFSPDGRRLVTGGGDGRVMVWKVRHPDGLPPTLTASGEKINAVAYSPDGRWLAAAGRDGIVNIWDAKTHALRHRLHGHRGWTYQVTFAPSSELLASTGQDHTVRLWDPETGRAVAVLRGHEDIINCAAFSPDGRLLASGSSDQSVRLWEVASGRLVRALGGFGDKVEEVAFSPKGDLVGAASRDRTVRLWSAPTGELLRTFRGHRDWATGLVFVGDAKVASSGKEATVLLWDVASGKIEARLEGHGRWINRLALSPDGRFLASASDDRTVRIWNLGTKAPMLVLSATQEVAGAAFSSDGRSIAMGDGSTVRLYPLDLSPLAVDPERALRLAEKTAGLRLHAFRLHVAE